MMKHMDISKLAVYADTMIGENLNMFSRRNIKKAIVSRKIEINPVFWNNGVLSWALRRYESIHKGNATPHHDALVGKHHKMRMVDDALYFYANYEYISREEKDAVYSFLKSYERDEAGSVLYRAGYPAAFLDTIGMIAPFLIRYGKEEGVTEATNLGMLQFRAFFENGMDNTSQLPYHGYNILQQEKCGIIGWGRGLGWLMMGLSESLSWLDKKSDDYKEVEQYFLQMTKVVLRYLRDDGSFSWQLQAMDGHQDTSVAGMIGYSLEHYNRITEQSLYGREVKVMINKLRDNISEGGVMLNSSAECKGFSMYPQVYEANSWGQGFGLLFFLEHEKRNG